MFDLDFGFLGGQCFGQAAKHFVNIAQLDQLFEANF